VEGAILAENRPVQYYLEVTTGPDKGLIHWLRGEPVKIGTVDGCDLVLSDPEVGSEHADVTLVRNRVWVENLSARGALLGGRALQRRTVMVVDEVLDLGEKTKVTLRSTGKSQEKSIANIVFPMILGLAVLGGLVLAITNSKAPVRRTGKVTHTDWERAYGRLQKRLDSWASQDMIDPEMSRVFAQAWFRECSGDETRALAYWVKMYNAMAGLSIEGVTPDGKTIATGAETSAESLRAFMARSMNDYACENNDNAFADALWWFVSKRIKILRDRQSN